MKTFRQVMCKRLLSVFSTLALLIFSECLYHLLPFAPTTLAPSAIWIQIGAKLSQQLLNPLQTRPVFLEPSVGKASANGESPRDSYERQRGWDRQIGKRRNGREKWWRDVPPVHYNEETIQLASLRGPRCWLPQTGQQVPSFYWLKPRGAEQRETWRDWSDRRLSNFCFISKEKQGQHILGNWAHWCVSLLLTCKCKTNQGNLVAVCLFFLLHRSDMIQVCHKMGWECVITYTKKCHYSLPGNQASR